MLATKAAICCLVISLSLAASTCKAEAEAEGYAPAPICARNDCPKYTVIHSQEDFEIRSYDRSVGISAPAIPSDFYKPAASKGFNMLLDYFKGHNQQNIVLNMTSPVLVLVENSSYKVFFFLPKIYQVNYPTPMAKEVQVNYMPYKGHKYAAVRRFDGFISDESIAMHFAALKKSVATTPYGSAAKGQVYMVASYNSPREFKNRVNEIFVWFD